MRSIVALLLAAVWTGSCATSALAAGIPPVGVSAQLTDAGAGVLTVHGNMVSSAETWTWQVCDEEGVACRPYGATGNSVEIGASPTGVRFKATSDAGASAVSATWNGPPHPLRAPAAIGAAQANSLVEPVRGVWTGGWEGDFEQAQLSACPTEAGIGCIPLTSRFYEERCSGEAAVTDPAFRGWYLRVASAVYGPDTTFAIPAVAAQYGDWPYFDSPWKASPTTDVAIVGRIAPPAGPRAASCGPPLMAGLPPRIAIQFHSARLTRQGVAIVECVTRCRADLRASARGRVAVTKSRQKHEIWLRIPPRRLVRLGHGRILYTLFVGGHRVAQATVKR